eukprot:gene11082-biopygen15384
MVQIKGQICPYCSRFDPGRYGQMWWQICTDPFQMALAVIWADLGRLSYAPEVSGADLPRCWIRSGADQGKSFSSPAQSAQILDPI